MSLAVFLALLCLLGKAENLIIPSVEASRGIRCYILLHPAGQCSLRYTVHGVGAEQVVATAGWPSGGGKLWQHQVDTHLWAPMSAFVRLGRVGCSTVDLVLWSQSKDSCAKHYGNCSPNRGPHMFVYVYSQLWL